MEILTIVLILAAVIGLSNIIQHFIPFVPVPLIQIALGMILAIIPMGIQVYLEPELFFLLFIAPLLFNDGKNASRTALWRLRTPILLLALGLVFATVFVIGHLIHWLIPSIPLSAAFALAAILSPTDVVAVGAIASRVHIPHNIMHVLEGEGLMNDASGLVAFKFALAATLTGFFSLSEAALSFLEIALGGFFGGALIAYLIIRFRLWLRRLGMEDVTIHMLIHLLTPFVIFAAIEHFHLSGILAVVAGGIVHAIERDHDESPCLQLRVVSKSTWTVLLYILNGLVFVLLGLEIPSVFRDVLSNPRIDSLQIFIYALIITLGIFALRFVWVYVSWWFGWKFFKKDLMQPSLKNTMITTLSGVRGAVTLAGAFSIPFALADGTPFPERSVILFIAAAVILITLVIASIFLPIICRTKEAKESAPEDLEKNALIQCHEGAICALQEAMNDSNREVALKIIASYNRSLNNIKSESNIEDVVNLKKEEIQVRLLALQAESACLEQLIAAHKVTEEIAKKAQDHLHKLEIAIKHPLYYRVLILVTILKQALYYLKRKLIPLTSEQQKAQEAENRKFIRVKLAMALAAVDTLKENETPENRHITYLVIDKYNKLIMRYKLAKNLNSPDELSQQERELQELAFQSERDVVQHLYEQGEIPFNVVQKVRQNINTREAYFFE